MTTSAAAKPASAWKSIVWSLVALALGGVMTYGLALLAKPPVLRQPTERTYNVDVFQVEALNIREVIRAFGTSQAEREVVVSAQVAGEVAERHPLLKIGQAVRALHSGASGATDGYLGDLLVRIDPKSFEAHVEQGRTLLAEDQAELKRIQQEEDNLRRLQKTVQADYDDSRREFQKAELLRKQNVNTDSDLRRAQMDLRQHEKMLVQSTNDLDLLPARRELVQRRIQTHEAALKLAELDLARTVVRPPFDGILSAVTVEVGQFVRVGEPLMTITDQKLVEVPLSVTLDDYAKLQAEVSARRFPAVELAENENVAGRWKGHVMRVSPKADEHTRTAMVYVQVDNSEQETPLLPGTFVQARIDGPILNGAILVPRDTVLDGKAFIEVDGVTRVRTVKTAKTLYNLSLIESGLQAGDRLVMTNLDVLYEGARARASQTLTLQQELEKHRTRAVQIVPAEGTTRAAPSPAP